MFLSRRQIDIREVYFKLVHNGTIARGLALTEIIIFSVTTLYAGETTRFDEGYLLGKRIESTAGVAKFEIPKELGEISGFYKGPKNEVVIHIQDAHVNEEAQRRIAGIIEYFVNQHHARLVNVEGASGELAHHLISAYPNQKARELVADYFLREGMLSGPEYLALARHPEFILNGVEEKSLYEENRKVFLEALEFTEKDNAVLRQWRRFVEKAARHVFSEKLWELTCKTQAFEDGSLELPAYLAYLEKIGAENKLDLAAYPQVNSFLKIVKLSEEENLGEEKKREYTQLRNSINLNLSNEIKKIESRAKEKLFRNEQEKKLSHLFEILNIYEKMFSFSLTKNDAEFFYANREAFHSEKFRDLLSPFLAQNHFEDPWEDLLLGRLDEDLRKIERFYALALKRDDVLIRNALAKMESSGEQISILVTGGFHTPGIERALREQGGSYLVITPRLEKAINEKEEKRRYASAMHSEPTQLSQLLTGAYFPARSGWANDPRYQLAIPSRFPLVSDLERISGKKTSFEPRRLLKEHSELDFLFTASAVLAATGIRMEEKILPISDLLKEMEPSLSASENSFAKWMYGSLLDGGEFIRAGPFRLILGALLNDGSSFVGLWAPVKKRGELSMHRNVRAKFRIDDGNELSLWIAPNRLERDLLKMQFEKYGYRSETRSKPEYKKQFRPSVEALKRPARTSNSLHPFILSPPRNSTSLIRYLPQGEELEKRIVPYVNHAVVSMSDAILQRVAGEGSGLSLIQHKLVGDNREAAVLAEALLLHFGRDIQGVMGFYAEPPANPLGNEQLVEMLNFLNNHDEPTSVQLGKYLSGEDLNAGTPLKSIYEEKARQGPLGLAAGREKYLFMNLKTPIPSSGSLHLKPAPVLFRPVSEMVEILNFLDSSDPRAKKLVAWILDSRPDRETALSEELLQLQPFSAGKFKALPNNEPLNRTVAETFLTGSASSGSYGSSSFIPGPAEEMGPERDSGSGSWQPSGVVIVREEPLNGLRETALQFYFSTATTENQHRFSLRVRRISDSGEEIFSNSVLLEEGFRPEHLRHVPRDDIPETLRVFYFEPQGGEDTSTSILAYNPAGHRITLHPVRDREDIARVIRELVRETTSAVLFQPAPDVRSVKNSTPNVLPVQTPQLLPKAIDRVLEEQVAPEKRNPAVFFEETLEAGMKTWFLFGERIGELLSSNRSVKEREMPTVNLKGKEKNRSEIRSLTRRAFLKISAMAAVAGSIFNPLKAFLNSLSAQLISPAPSVEDSDQMVAQAYIGNINRRLDPSHRVVLHSTLRQNLVEAMNRRLPREGFTHHSETSRKDLIPVVREIFKDTLGFSLEGLNEFSAEDWIEEFFLPLFRILGIGAKSYAENRFFNHFRQIAPRLRNALRGLQIERDSDIPRFWVTDFIDIIRARDQDGHSMAPTDIWVQLNRAWKTEERVPNVDLSTFLGVTTFFTMVEVARDQKIIVDRNTWSFGVLFTTFSNSLNGRRALRGRWVDSLRDFEYLDRLKIDIFFSASTLDTRRFLTGNEGPHNAAQLFDGVLGSASYGRFEAPYVHLNRYEMVGTKELASSSLIQTLVSLSRTELWPPHMTLSHFASRVDSQSIFINMLRQYAYAMSLSQPTIRDFYRGYDPRLVENTRDGWMAGEYRTFIVRWRWDRNRRELLPEYIVRPLPSLHVPDVVNMDYENQLPRDAIRLRLQAAAAVPRLQADRIHIREQLLALAAGLDMGRNSYWTLYGIRRGLVHFSRDGSPHIDALDTMLRNMKEIRPLVEFLFLRGQGRFNLNDDRSMGILGGMVKAMRLGGIDPVNFKALLAMAADPGLQEETKQLHYAITQNPAFQGELNLSDPNQIGALLGWVGSRYVEGMHKTRNKASEIILAFNDPTRYLNVHGGKKITSTKREKFFESANHLRRVWNPSLRRFSQEELGTAPPQEDDIIGSLISEAWASIQSGLPWEKWVELREATIKRLERGTASDVHPVRDAFYMLQGVRRQPIFGEAFEKAFQEFLRDLPNRPQDQGWVIGWAQNLVERRILASRPWGKEVSQSMVSVDMNRVFQKASLYQQAFYTSMSARPPADIRTTNLAELDTVTQGWVMSFIQDGAEQGWNEWIGTPTQPGVVDRMIDFLNSMGRDTDRRQQVLREITSLYQNTFREQARVREFIPESSLRVLTGLILNNRDAQGFFLAWIRRQVQVRSEVRQEPSIPMNQLFQALESKDEMRRRAILSRIFRSVDAEKVQDGLSRAVDQLALPATASDQGELIANYRGVQDDAAIARLLNEIAVRPRTKLFIFNAASQSDWAHLAKRFTRPLMKTARQVELVDSKKFNQIGYFVRHRAEIRGIKDRKGIIQILTNTVLNSPKERELIRRTWTQALAIAEGKRTIVVVGVEEKMTDVSIISLIDILRESFKLMQAVQYSA